jgi:hypothetical protein
VCLATARAEFWADRIWWLACESEPETGRKRDVQESCRERGFVSNGRGRKAPGSVSCLKKPTLMRGLGEAA